ncbi:hypothetical protein E8P82_05430 [Arthrobacter echini]|uniref:DUF2567 domain-containing protein n=1 Tax=Arthrobacter echini TaxID=1529066 RepID=A0A4S5E7E2_9MICC|nr:hypothetical protein [Arthrobacter echini]THJ67535.1 hypothetical protein E8P82_05430 [Arthrobacter echini]
MTSARRRRNRGAGARTGAVDGGTTHVSRSPDTAASTYPPPVYPPPVYPPSVYPPSVYSPAEDRRSAPPAGVLWWLGSTILLGVLVGVTWWLLAPTGRIFGDPTVSTQWVLRDLAFAGLELVAGVTIGVVLALRLSLPAVVPRITAALGGSVIGSLLALGVGQGLASLLGPDGRVGLPGSDFALASYGALAIWPATTAIVVFVVALIGLARRRS